jgi:hypothetical protein
MSQLTTWLERSSYLAVIACSLTIAAAVLHNQKSQNKYRDDGVRTSALDGKHIALNGVDWKANSKTLVLALSTSCHFCSASAPFYRKLVDFQQGHPRLSIVAVLPQPVTEAEKYFETRELPIRNVYSSNLFS